MVYIEASIKIANLDEASIKIASHVHSPGDFLAGDLDDALDGSASRARFINSKMERVHACNRENNRAKTKRTFYNISNSCGIEQAITIHVANGGKVPAPAMIPDDIMEFGVRTARSRNHCDSKRKKSHGLEGYNLFLKHQS